MADGSKATNILVMSLREIFAANLRARRKELKLSQEELAHRTGLDRTYVSALERSRYAVSVDVIAKLAEQLDLAPHQLLKASPRNSAD